jgi:hypothetical protein
MERALASDFRKKLLETLRDERHAEPLRAAALTGLLMPWTKALTAASVEACQRLGWRASAKGHHAELLPVSRGEYLNLDLVAFGAGDSRWRFPLAVMELENQKREDFIAYSLWKLLSVRAELRVLFCYRKEAAEAGPLRIHLQEQVVEALGIGGRVALEGRTLLVVGRRAEVETFPHGFFGWWELETNTGRFESF